MNFYTIGLMSGTSLDGLDICFSQFQKLDEKWSFTILKTTTIAYSKIWENKLRNAIYCTPEELYQLNTDYGFYLGEMVNHFIRENKIENCDLIASHGHTVFHQPDKKFTVQIGDGRAIKLATEIPVVYDFRMQDVLMGGNGAPLVPIGDELLFSEYEACLNLGGFSNISFRKEGKRIAFDICAVNIVLNAIAQKLGKEFDENGAIAKQGKVDKALLEHLNEFEYYTQKPPKSLGVEWVNQNIAKCIQSYETEIVLATFTEHIAIQIAHILNSENLENVLFTGGGTYNTFLLERIQSLTEAKIIVPTPEIIEYKEALIFAFMGVLKMQNINNVLSSATGSTLDHCSGVIA